MEEVGHLFDVFTAHAEEAVDKRFGKNTSRSVHHSNRSLEIDIQQKEVRS